MSEKTSHLCATHLVSRNRFDQDGTICIACQAYTRGYMEATKHSEAEIERQEERNRKNLDEIELTKRVVDAAKKFVDGFSIYAVEEYGYPREWHELCDAVFSLPKKLETTKDSESSKWLTPEQLCAEFFGPDWRTNPDYRRARAWVRESLMDKIKPCIGNDPLCPCQDGLMCHYDGPDAWPLPEKE